MPDPFSGLVVSAINGWRGLPGARGSNDSIPGAHGSYGGTRVLREGRSIEVRGAAIAATEFEAVALLDALEAEVADRPVTMWVHDSHGAWSRVVEIEAIQVIGAWNRDRIIFAIDAFASDPRRYQGKLTAGPVGIPVQDGGLMLPREFPWDFGVSVRGVAEVINSGKIATLPRIIVEGSADAITIYCGVHRLIYGTFSGTLVFDSTQRRAWLNGADVTRFMLRRDWPVVQAETQVDISFSATEPSPETVLTVEYLIGAM